MKRRTDSIMGSDQYPEALRRLQQCFADGRISALSYHFAAFIARQADADNEALLLYSAALLSERNQRGDVCVDLSDYAGRVLFDAAQEREGAGYSTPVGPDSDDWQARLTACRGCVGKPGEYRPLILDSGQLYLQRFWQDEKEVAEGITARLERPRRLDSDVLDRSLQRLFPARGTQVQPDWQKLACALAVRQQFAVISGGPGTGKTTTVIKVLVALLEQDSQLRIRLAAPTGKAAARMVESIRDRKEEIDIPGSVRERIPDAASTLHRLLARDHRGGFRYHRDNPLPLDCLVVDEASMIDLNMMARLLEALPAHARLILLGDRQQLASVDAGNVLGDITGRGRPLTYGRELAGWLARRIGMPLDDLAEEEVVAPVADAIALLRTSYRFSDNGGIGRLAALINEGQGDEALALVRGESALAGSELSWLAPVDGTLDEKALDWALERYRNYLACEEVGEALRVFDGTRVLCAMHEGPLGDAALNRRIEEGLRARGWIGHGQAYRGKPIMIRVNDHELQLFNGDIGLIWPDESGELRAWFPQAGGGERGIALRNLPDHLPAWALTVHKSQGSEFDQVLLILPADSNSPLLSRELLYTGVTRARRRVLIHAQDAPFLGACQRRVKRSSGLARALGWPC